MTSDRGHNVIRIYCFTRRFFRRRGPQDLPLIGKTTSGARPPPLRTPVRRSRYALTRTTVWERKSKNSSSRLYQSKNVLGTYWRRRRTRYCFTVTSLYIYRHPEGLELAASTLAGAYSGAHFSLLSLPSSHKRRTLTIYVLYTHTHTHSPRCDEVRITLLYYRSIFIIVSSGAWIRVHIYIYIYLYYTSGQWSLTPIDRTRGGAIDFRYITSCSSYTQSDIRRQSVSDPLGALSVPTPLVRWPSYLPSHLLETTGFHWFFFKRATTYVCVHYINTYYIRLHTHTHMYTWALSLCLIGLHQLDFDTAY